MDRFIGFITQIMLLFIQKFKIQYGQIYRINSCKLQAGRLVFKIQYGQIYSNEIHFFALCKIIFKIQYGQIYSRSRNVNLSFHIDLKSNMDRFIEIEPNSQLSFKILFKIQYGQIYSEMGISDVENMQQFKIQYGQIYSRFYVSKHNFKNAI